MTKQKQNNGSGANAAPDAQAAQQPPMANAAPDAQAAQQPPMAKDAQAAQQPPMAKDAQSAQFTSAAKEDAAAKAKAEAEAKAKEDAEAKAKAEAEAKAKEDAAAKAKAEALDRVRIGKLIEEIDMRAARDFEGLLHRLQTEDGLSISDGDGGFVTVRLLGVRSRGRNPRLAVANWANAARRALRQPDPVDDPADATA